MMKANDTIFRRGLRRARQVVAAAAAAAAAAFDAAASEKKIAAMDLPAGSAFVRWYSIRQHDGRRPSGVGHNLSKWHITLDGSTTLCGCRIDLYPEIKPTRPTEPVCRRCLANERIRCDGRDKGNAITTASGD